MGKIIKFLLAAILCLFLLGMVMGFIERYGGILLAIVIIGCVLGVVGNQSSNQSSQSNPEPVKRPEDDKIEKLHVDMED